MIDQARLKKLLDYDPCTGLFRWRHSQGTKHKGAVAGSIKPRGHIVIKLDYVCYKAHRLAWLYVTGEWPKNQIDHKDCNPGNNSFDNLREATNSQNHMNMPVPSTNTSGFKGVRLDKRRGKWQANIKKNGKSKFLGYFDEPEKAHAAYVRAAADMFGQYARVE